MSSLFGTDTSSWLAPYLPEGNGWFLAVGVILLTVLSAVVSLAAVAFALTRLPPDYFVNPHAQRPIDRHPLLKILLAILRNIFGYFLVALGIVLSLPGVPGQGLLTIFLGVLLVDFPGKVRVLRWFLTRRGVLEGINHLRRRWGHPPLLRPQSSDSQDTSAPSLPTAETSVDSSLRGSTADSSLHGSTAPLPAGSGHPAHPDDRPLSVASSSPPPSVPT
jgi:hypothetical protein